MSLAGRATVLLLALAAPPAAAEEPALRWSGLLQLWGTYALDSSLRDGEVVSQPSRYYSLRSEFRRDDVSVRRAELKLRGQVAPSVAFEVMIDPAIAVSSSNILQDAVISLRPGAGLELRAGQMKTAQTYEGLRSSAALPLVERSQLARLLGDVRDRGVTLAFARGPEHGWHARALAGAFSGAGRGADANASKDLVARLEGRLSTRHSLGAYGLWGSTDQPGAPAGVPLAFAGGAAAPTPEQVRAAADGTRNLGGFYVYEDARWSGEAEVAWARLGRHFASIGPSAGPARREHLEQSFLGLTLTAVRRFGRHALALRFDRADYNHDARYYTSFDPYLASAPGAPRPGDWRPRFSEWTAGYTLSLSKGEPTAALVRLNYIHRSDNVLLDPAAGPEPRGGDGLVVLLQAAF
ncbi:MAG: porin [Vicinamibacteria bacterium]